MFLLINFAINDKNMKQINSCAAAKNSACYINFPLLL